MFPNKRVPDNLGLTVVYLEKQFHFDMEYCSVEYMYNPVVLWQTKYMYIPVVPQQTTCDSQNAGCFVYFSSLLWIHLSHLKWSQQIALTLPAMNDARISPLFYISLNIYRP